VVLCPAALEMGPRLSEAGYPGGDLVFWLSGVGTPRFQERCLCKRRGYLTAAEQNNFVSTYSSFHSFPEGYFVNFNRK